MTPDLTDSVTAYPKTCRPAVLDWMETHSRIMGFWLDRLIAEGDEGDVVTLLHRQQSWLAMMQEKLRK